MKRLFHQSSRPRNIRGGIRITGGERPDLDKEAWFDGETVTINQSHPAYKKAKTMRLLNYHVVKAVVLSLIEFNLESLIINSAASIRIYIEGTMMEVL